MTTSCFSLAQSTAAYQHCAWMLIRVSKIKRTHHEPVCDPICSYTGAPNSGRRGAVFLQDVDRSQSAGAQVRNRCSWHGMPRVLPQRIGSVEAGCTRRRSPIILASFRYASLRKNDRGPVIKPHRQGTGCRPYTDLAAGEGPTRRCPCSACGQGAEQLVSSFRIKVRREQKMAWHISGK